MDLAAVRPLPAYLPSGSPRSSVRLANAGAALAATVVVLQTAAHLANAFLLSGRYAVLDAATEGNAFSWAASLATVAAAAAALTLAMGLPARRLHAGMLAVVVGFLAMDDMVDLHDVLAADVAPSLPGRLADLGSWTMPLVYLPVLAIAFALLLRTARRAPFVAARPLWVGLALLSTAIAVRVGAGVVKLEGDVLPSGVRTLGIALHQGAELGGWILIAAGLAAATAAARNSGRLPTNRRRPPRSVEPDRL